MKNYFMKRWWGYSCFLLFLIVLIFYQTFFITIQPSSANGGITFLGKETAGKMMVISKPPDKFTLLTDKQEVKVDLKQLMAGTEEQNVRPFPMTLDGDLLRVANIDAHVSEKLAKQLWQRGATVKVTESNGSLEFNLIYDDLVSIVKGVYVIKDGQITKHYFKTGNVLFFLLCMLLPLPLYLAGQIVRFGIRLIQGYRDEE